MSVTGAGALGLVGARILFGGVLAFMGLNHFMEREEMAGYAEYKGLPAPMFSVIASGALLILGGVAIVAGVFPGVGALAIAGFLLVSAVTMHDFWAVPAEEQQDEMVQFLKNVALAGGAFAFVAIATLSWEYSAGIGMF